MRIAACLSGMALAMTVAAPSHAELVPEYPSAVGVFGQACLVPGVEVADRENAIGNLPGWHEDASVTVDLPKLGVSRAIERNYSFASPTVAKQWSGTLDGKPARFVVASFSEKDRYPHVCALVVEGAANAMPYGRALKDAFKAYGIGSKSVDLVHYYEFAGKVGPDKHPVRGEVFSRSQAGTAKDTMHIYVAF